MTIDLIKQHEKWLYGEIEKRPDLSGTNLSGTNLSGANLRRANLRRANLHTSNLSGADLRYANLSDATLRYANLSGTDLSDATLSYANLSDATLRYANLSGARINSKTKLPAPTIVLLAEWGYVSEELCNALMNYDAHNHSNPELFDMWANGGECPYNNFNFQRCVNFTEQKYLWKKLDTVKSAYELVQLLFKEKLNYVE